MEDIRSYYKPNCQIDSNLMCRICNALPINAQECCHCENLFCAECVNLQKNKNDQCPEKCEGTFQTKQPHRSVRNKLGEISFKCLNQQMGCTESIYMNDVMKHAAECQYKKMVCSCGWIGPLSKLELHEQQCEDKKTQLCEICKEEIKLSLYPNHNCIKDLSEQIEKVQEKFNEYKEHSKQTIEELKINFEQEIKESQILKQQIQIALNQNVDLKKQQEALKEFVIAQVKVLEETNAQQTQITKGQLADSGNLKCNQGHILQFWVNSQGEEKTKKCTKCNKTQTCCRYLDLGCKKIYCLNCVHPELYTDSMVNATFCPAKHRLSKRIQGLRCSICDRCSYEMKQPGGADCTQCDFAICFECMEQKKYDGNKLQSCPVQ